MFSNLSPLIAAVSALLPGLIIGYLIRQIVSSRKAAQAESRAEQILADSKSKAQDILLEAKNKALEILEEAKKDEKERNSQLARIENLLTKKENELESKAKELKTEKENLISKAQEMANLKVEFERVASLSKEQAKTELFTKVEEESKDELYKKMIKLEQESKEELNKKAREIVTLAVQRYAASQIADAVSTVVSLPSNELKGKIIGKEGRNIKTIERMTGVDIIIDDTPEALVISGFD